MNRFELFKRLVQAVFVVLVLALASAEMALLFAPDDTVLAFADDETVIGRKSDNVTANFNARSHLPGPVVRAARFRANAGAWKELDGSSPRQVRRHFLMEVHARDLIRGANNLEVELRSLLGFRRRIHHPFQYRDDMPSFPIISDWATQAPEVQDGFWEVIRSEVFGYAIRPQSGDEGYDRFVLIAPPFKGSRRITVDLRFVEATDALHGFGILPFWGGHLDPTERFPRRGWEYGIAWYYAVRGGFGAEFSKKIGGEPHATDRIYRPFSPAPGEAFRIVVEALDLKGRKTIKLRVRSLPHGAFGEWIELLDVSGHLQSDRYAVGLVAHRAQVEFGRTIVERIDGGTHE
jgi:hypothetical protein